tara:strand:- start:180 stop:425 length:246 start_codon:yes stop_codon:yes gene_type:complete
MKPLWEIFKVKTTTNEVHWILDGQLVKSPIVFYGLENLHIFMESFHEINKVHTPTKVRSGDASTPKHPYDRDDQYWEETQS